MTGVWVIVVAAGSGTRFGKPKQYEALGDQRVLDWSLCSARGIAEGIVAVVPAERLGCGEPGAEIVVAGGQTRSESVRAGLAMIPKGASVIVVHDAARPLASPALFQGVVSALAGGADAAVPGLGVVDTIKRVRRGVVVATLDRAELVAVQTPQAFRAASLRIAHAGGGEATDDAALIEATGGTVTVVAGDRRNVKVTTVEDLEQARLWVAERLGAEATEKSE